jgi:hypothetical protein
VTLSEALLAQVETRLNAELLNLDRIGFPADLELALKIESIRLARDPTTERSHARASLTRFTVAHEIAHCVVARQFGVLTSTVSEYWKLEELCNQFAAKLLIPEDALSDYNVPDDPFQLLETVAGLARDAQVSSAVAGRRLADWRLAGGLDVTIAGLVGRFSRSARSATAVAKVEWSGGTTAGMGKGQLIGPRHPAFDLISRAFDEDGLPSSNLRAGVRETSASGVAAAIGLTPTQVGYAWVGVD